MRKTHLAVRSGSDYPGITTGSGTLTVQVIDFDNPDNTQGRTFIPPQSFTEPSYYPTPGWYPVCGAPRIPLGKRKPGGAITCQNCRRTKAYREWVESMRETLRMEEAA